MAELELMELDELEDIIEELDICNIFYLLSKWLYNIGQNSAKFSMGQFPVWFQNQYKHIQVNTLT